MAEREFVSLVDIEKEEPATENLSKREQAILKLYPSRIVESKKENNQTLTQSQKVSLSAKTFENEQEKVEEPEVVRPAREIYSFDPYKFAKPVLKMDKPTIEAEEEFEQVEEPKEEVELIKEKVPESAKVIYEEKKTHKNLKLRLKLAIVAGILVLTCLGGGSIYNAVRIHTLNAEAQRKSMEYSINVGKVVSNVSKLDDLTNPNSITNLDELADAEVVKVIPKESSVPNEVSKKSNWFDRLCNWLSNLFN